MALIACNSPVSVRRLWQGRLLTGAGLALLPWLGFLAATLPPREAAAWVALDALEAACLLTAGARLARGTGGHRAPAAGAAVLGAADACMDLLTSAPGAEFATAAAMAVCAELPLAGLCAALAAQGVRAALDVRAAGDARRPAGRWARPASDVRCCRTALLLRCRGARQQPSRRLPR
ncbi:hypothetical protein AB0M39_18330 [Streptomyces sp. NPDC051907]|uniref:hypothetical protein n=1 Tax=Streptomyces sp. NPDC051907 TaxID=3155284 RepID=UPI00341E16C2